MAAGVVVGSTNALSPPLVGPAAGTIAGDIFGEACGVRFGEVEGDVRRITLVMYVLMVFNPIHA